jgi:HSP20 family protein
MNLKTKTNLEDKIMTLVRTNHGVPTYHWNNELSNLMNRFFNDEMMNEACYSGSKPAVNIRELENSFEMELVVPGMKKEDFIIKFENERLEISAEHVAGNGEENDKYTRREFVKKSFKRSFRVAEKIIDGDGISARYEDGILNVTLPKREEAKPKPAKEIKIS